MKLVSITLIALNLFAINAEAISIGDIIKGVGVIVGDRGGNFQRPPMRPPGHGGGIPYPDYPPHHGGGHHPRPPHHGGGHHPPPPPPYYPPQPPPYQPPYPNYPGSNVTCNAVDKGWEEHGGGHRDCYECVRYHGRCVETCSSNNFECRVDGYDQYGRLVSFYGQNSDQWRAEEQGIQNCRYGYASNCTVVSCQQRQDVISRRDCR